MSRKWQYIFVIVFLGSIMQAGDKMKTGVPHYTLEKLERPLFVVQEHSARTHHYDFRLEIGGTLVSWAVPKGPPLKPAEKRLAIPTEDHDLEYALFEGVIPKGEYGAGGVLLWDRGTYKNLRDTPMKTCLKEGTIEIELLGEKLRGSYALVKTKMTSGKKPSWLFIKTKDNGTYKKPNDSSIVTGRTMKQIEKEEE